MIVPAFIHLLLKCDNMNVIESEASSHFEIPVCFHNLNWIDAALDSPRGGKGDMLSSPTCSIFSLKVDAM